MAKQKFCCKGILQKTGQRATITISADSKERAVQIALEHGVTVDSVTLAADQAAGPSKAAAAQPKPVAGQAKPAAAQPRAASSPPKVSGGDLDARLDAILDADDELDKGLGGFGLDDELGGPAVAPSTKACPYCGEQILAVAVKCKHCGSYVGEKTGSPLARSGGVPSRGVPMRVWAIAGGVGVVLIVVLLIVLLRNPSTPQPVPRAVESPVVTTPTPPVASKAEGYKPTPEDMAFAAKAVAFLDTCDEMVQLLDKAPTPEAFDKECEVMKSRQAAIPHPPKGVRWAEEVASANEQIVSKLSLVSQLIAGLATIQAMDPASNPKDSPELRDAYHQAAEQMRGLLRSLRSLIPPECSAKPK
jgi:hypothetical protein